MQVYKNFLPQNIYKEIYSQLTGSRFAWYNYKSVVSDSAKRIDNFFIPDVFRHCVVFDYKVQSQWIELLEPVVLELSKILGNDIELINFHANWMFPNNAFLGQVDYPHIDKDDFTSNCFTALYYLNDCMGDTILYDQQVKTNSDIEIDTLSILHRIRPEANKLVIWEADRVHSAPAYIVKPRMVLNLNIRTKNGI